MNTKNNKKTEMERVICFPGRRDTKNLIKNKANGIKKMDVGEKF